MTATVTVPSGMTNAVMLVCVLAYDRLTINSCSWNGSAMTANGAQSGTSGGTAYTARGYYILNPTAGSHTLSASLSGSNTAGGFLVAFYEGVGAVTSGENKNDTGSKVTGGSFSVTTSQAGEWGVILNGTGGPTDDAPSAGVTTTRTVTSPSAWWYFDSNGSLGSSGAHTLSWTQSSDWWYGGSAFTLQVGSNTYNQTVAATGTGAAAVLKAITSSAAVLHATGAGTAAVTKAVTMSITTLHAIGAGTAAVLKQMSKTLAATGVGVATTSATKVFLQALAAIGAGVATLATTPGKVLASTGAGIATVVKTPGKVLASTGQGVAAVTKQMAKTLSSSGVALATTTATLGKNLAVIAVGVATIVKTPGKVLAATAVGSAVLTAGRGVIMQATAAATATLAKTPGKVLSVVASAVALIRKDFWRTKYTPQGDDYGVKYPHGE